MMPEASGTELIQAGQASTLTAAVAGPSSAAVSAGTDLAEDAAPPGGVADVDMIDASGGQGVCINPAADSQSDSAAAETDADRCEDGEGGEAAIAHASEVTVDDVTAWPAVHALAMMAQAPSSGHAAPTGLGYVQETSHSEPNPGEHVEDDASDDISPLPNAFPSSASDPGVTSSGIDDELLFEEQDLGGGGAPSHLSSSAPSASQSVMAQALSGGHGHPHHGHYMHGFYHTGHHHYQAPTSTLPYIETTGIAGFSSLHEVLADGQTEHSHSANGSGIGHSYYYQQPQATNPHAINAQASSNPVAVYSVEISVTDDLQITGTASVQYLTPAHVQTGQEPGYQASIPTDIINAGEGAEVGFGEDFEETSSEGSSTDGFEDGHEGNFEGGPGEGAEEEANGELGAQAGEHIHNGPLETQTPPAVMGTIHQPQPVAAMAQPPVVNPTAFNPHALNTNPMYNNLSPANHSLGQLLVHWSELENIPKRPSRRSIDRQLGKPLTCVRSQDLYGDQHDFQGINWMAMGVTRKQAREIRSKSFHNYVSVKDSDLMALRPGDKMPWNSESYFRFRRMHVKPSVHLAHFQLRNLLASTSRSYAFYAQSRGVVRKINTLTGVESVAMRFAEHSSVLISTIAADKNVLVAGGFGGEYCISDLASEYVGAYSGTTRAEGTVTRHAGGISNHIQIHSLRNSSGPLAAFASNDLGLRVLDLKTGKVVSAVQFLFPVNCTAISPDRRLRVVVGDSLNAYVTAAETERSTVRRGSLRQPEVLKVLEGHKDYGFACAWAPDGYTLATGNQDRTIKIWDARKWGNSRGESTPVATLYTEMAGVRSLHFSPTGSGKRVLVAAEEADFVKIIDAQSFRTCQTLDIFGEIGGVSLTSAGRDLLVLCADRTRGGLLHFERCDTEATLGNGGGMTSRNKILEMRRPGSGGLDWPGQPDEDTRRRQRTNRLRLRAAAAVGMEPF